ncbi:DUF4262 domain-containing protein [Actinokineospora diospyrosa]|uniref:DUF4262 domain-containing protein n=1 Tax=Actinokineospora diospyrosa TaxID=103728 RepID=UPI0020A2D49C|nr:DUF4262 domain-containing protein [Actinokineospora diospyrosa]
MRCRCQLCVGDRDEGFAEMLEAITDYGAGVVEVTGAQFDFAHTVGLWHSAGVPDVVMFGLDTDDMIGWLSRFVEVGRAQGWPGPDEEFGGVVDGAVTRLRPVHESWFGGLLDSVLHFYREPVPMSVLLWPDGDGRWPWDADADEDCRVSQPWAWGPVSEQQAGPWRLLGELGAEFPFPTSPDVWALTSKSIVDGDRAPVWLARSEGLYDVLDERGYGADDLALAYLGDITTRHPVLYKAADLPDDAAVVVHEGIWTPAERGPEHLEASIAAWQSAGTV